MHEIIKISNAVIGKDQAEAVNARDLHKGLGVRRDFTNWIKARIEKYGFEEGQDFVVAQNLGILLAKSGEQDAQNTGSWGGHNTVDYAISLDMAKELAMIESNDKGREVRRYFIACEKKLKQTQTKELMRLSNIESAWEKSERAYVELDHTVHNKYDSLIAEVKNLKLAVAEERKDVRDQLIDEKAEKLFSTWKRQLGKIWAERFKIIQENLLAIEKRYAKLHQFHDLDIERFISRALHETGAAVPD